MQIGFWGYPDPEVLNKVKNQYPNCEFTDLDIDFSYPKTNILPESYCKIIRNIIDNAIYLKPELILAPIGKDKCDSGWFAARILKDMGFNVIETKYEQTVAKRDVKICDSILPLYDKVNLITAGIIDSKIYDKNYEQTDLKKGNFVPGFWGVPPNDLSILKLFPNTTRVYGWLRCVEAGTPADIDLEMFVEEDVPTVFYSQAFCAKAQLAKYLADKYNGLYIDIDDYASNSIKAKVEAFLKLR